MIYLDANANYPMDAKLMKQYLKGVKCGNISSNPCKFSDDTINNLKDVLREYHNAPNYKVIFTSGGSESNSTIINHVFYNNVKKGKLPIHVVASTIEHPSVTEKLKQLQDDKLANITWIKPNTSGLIDIDEFKNSVTNETDLVMCQYINSETGTIQPIVQIQQICTKTNTLFAVDNVQGFMKKKYPFNTNENTQIGDFISVSFHKIGGPIGIGALLYDSNIELSPLVSGKQNDGCRGGTYNIAALCASLEAIKQYDYYKPAKNGEHFWNQLEKKIPVYNYSDYNKMVNNGAILKGKYIVRINEGDVLPHVVFFTLMNGPRPYCGIMIKNKMKLKGYIIGTGSACNSVPGTSDNIGSMKSSDISQEIKVGFLRISFVDNDKKEINQFIEELCNL